MQRYSVLCYVMSYCIAHYLGGVQLIRHSKSTVSTSSAAITATSSAVGEEAFTTDAEVEAEALLLLCMASSLSTRCLHCIQTEQ